jgi:hypothetical protein
MIIRYFTQILITLDLKCTRIGDRGVQHLANALQQNTVKLSFSHRIVHLLFPTDTHHTSPGKQSDQ